MILRKVFQRGYGGFFGPVLRIQFFILLFCLGVGPGFAQSDPAAISQVNVSQTVGISGVVADEDARESSLISLRWADEKYQSLVVMTPLPKSDIEGCVQAGLELEHRFLIKFCERLKNLGITCEDEKRVIHNVTLDPIQESYRIATDRLDDEEDPIVTTFQNINDALMGAATISALPLSYIGRGEAFERFVVGRAEGDQVQKWLLGLRVRTTCKGEVPRFLADLSYFFTFGMVDLYGRDSGWEYFELSSGNSLSLNREESSSDAAGDLPRSGVQ